MSNPIQEDEELDNIFARALDGMPAHEFKELIKAYSEQKALEARIDENRRSGAFWGGLANEEKLAQGMKYMNRRDSKLYAQLTNKNTEGKDE